MILSQHLFLRKALHRIATSGVKQPLHRRRPLSPYFHLNSFQYPNYQVRMASTLPKNVLFQALVDHDAQSTAIAQTSTRQKFTYGQLVRDVAYGRVCLDGKLKAMQVKSECIAFLAENGYEYVGAHYLLRLKLPFAIGISSFELFSIVNQLHVKQMRKLTQSVLQ